MRLTRGPRLLLALPLALWLANGARAQDAEPSTALDADLALVIAVDVSQSVDAARYRLQMDGIAQALEDPDVVTSILSGPRNASLIALVIWADRPSVAVPWQRVTSADDAHRLAGLIRALPHRGGEFTCVGRMLDYVREAMLPDVASRAPRMVVDVSGDGIDNCSDSPVVDAARDDLVAAGAVINGLPIIVAGENDVVGAGAYRAPGYGLRAMPHGPGTETTTLDQWFGQHVIGGRGAFLIKANGYRDFGRAIERKLVVEISGIN